MFRNITPQFVVLLVWPFSLAAAPVDYHADIAPLLRDYCAGCHNAGDFEGEFSVETFAALMEGGETAEKRIVVPGKPEDSYLLQTVLKAAKPAMPPKKEPQPTADEIALLTRWIAEGAKGPAKEHDISLLSTLNVPDMAPTAAVKDAITAAAFASDGSVEAFAKHGRIELIGADGKLLRTLKVPEGKINALHFAVAGTRLVAATGISGLKGEAIVFDVKSGSIIKTIGEGTHRDILFDAEFSPDGTLLATAGYDRDIHLWDFASGKHLRSMTSHNGAVYDLAFSPDGTVIASASGDGTCKIWQVATGERFDTLNQPEAEQFRVAFTPDSRHIIAAGGDNRIRLWSFVSKSAPMLNPLLQTRFGHEDAIVDLVISPDGKQLATTSADRSLKLWSLPSLEPVLDLGPQSDVLAVLAFAGKGGLFAARLDGSEERIPLAPGNKIVPTANTTGPAPVAGASEADGETQMLTEAAPGVNPKLTRRSEAKGKIGAQGERDDYPFTAKAGETWVFEVNAARAKSKLDSKLAIFDAKGDLVEQVVLQAVRDSWLTFRGKDSTVSTDFRVHNWEEMELNELLFVNGEVVKLHLYPRGPDSGFNVYPGVGSRRTWFQTTPMTHPLGQPCYIVRALPAGSTPVSNGLPLYRLFYENDDDPERRYGSDSVLRFTAPVDGDYLLRISDVRGFGGEGYDYSLVTRHLRPDFSVTLGTKDLKIAPGSGKELLFTATRTDGFDGPIDLDIAGLPAHLSVPAGLTIEAGQDIAYTMLSAGDGFAGLSEADAAKVTITARARIGAGEIHHQVGHLTPVEALADKKVRVALKPDGDSGRVGDDGILEFTVRPGQTITALATVERNGFAGEVPFGKEDAGRNLPHGVYVDNIGLSGLMIQDGQTEQRVFITASKIVPEMSREFHLVTTVDGGHGTPSVRLRVVRGDQVADK
jgi:dipeptidyl aminopeptidase/acylaminoacyl peptidase/mono/diheme cytochrome c family protein